MKSPAFQLYVRDVICSKTIGRLHARRDGRGLAYLYLLCEAWLEDPPGSLPNDPVELAAMAKLSVNEFADFWLLVQHQFVLSEQDGRLYQHRLVRCWSDQQSRKLRGSKGGEASGKARRVANGQANDEAKRQAGGQRVEDEEAEAVAGGKRRRTKGDQW